MVLSSLPKRRGLVVKLTNLCRPTSACCGRSVSIRLPRCGCTERLHSVLSAYAPYVGIRREFLCMHKISRRTERAPTYECLWQCALNARANDLPTCISVRQRMLKIRHAQAYAKLISLSVTSTLNDRKFQKRVKMLTWKWQRKQQHFLGYFYITPMHSVCRKDFFVTNKLTRAYLMLGTGGFSNMPLWGPLEFWLAQTGTCTTWL